MKERDLWVIICLLSLGILLELSHQRIERLNVIADCHTKAMIEWEEARGSIWPVAEEEAAWRKCAREHR